MSVLGLAEEFPARLLQGELQGVGRGGAPGRGRTRPPDSPPSERWRPAPMSRRLTAGSPRQCLQAQLRAPDKLPHPEQARQKHLLEEQVTPSRHPEGRSPQSTGKGVLCTPGHATAATETHSPTSTETGSQPLRRAVAGPARGEAPGPWG